jgi:lipopolysaccharide export system protein LptA
MTKQIKKEIKPMQETANRKSKMMITAFLTVAGLLAGNISASAQTVQTGELSKSVKKKQKVDIESNTMEIVDGKNQAVFTGKVIAKRGDVTLNADKLVVDFIKEKVKDGEDKTKVTFLNATGHILIVTRKQRITGQWAKMNVKADTAVVGGNVVVHQGSSIIRGKKLNVNLKTDRSVMTGGRVRGTFTPN